MRLLLKVVPVLALAGVLTIASGAKAAPPTACTMGRNQIMYNAGILKGASLVNQAWGATDVQQNCDNWDLFEFQVKRVYALVISSIPPNASQAIQCMFYGEQDGALARLAELFSDCEIPCADQGTLVADLASMLYCELSMALEGLGLDVYLPAGDVESCGTAFQDACQAEFLAETGTYAGCEPYTMCSGFDEPWHQAQFNQCLYNPQAGVGPTPPADVCPPPTP
jgi:hypothetical protein